MSQLSAEELFQRGTVLQADPLTVQEALDCYLKVLEVEPNYTPALINIGTVYSQLGYVKLAERYFRKATVMSPKYVLAWYNLGSTLSGAEAVECYKTVLQLNSTFADAYFNLALEYDRQKEPRKALAYWQKYLKLAPNEGEWTSRARTRIKEITSKDRLKLVFVRKN
jgi:superkiller protein 3